MKSKRRSFLKTFTGATAAAFVPIKLPDGPTPSDRPYPTLPIRYVDGIHDPREGVLPFVSVKNVLFIKNAVTETRVPVWLRPFSVRRTEIESLSLHIDAAFGFVNSMLTPNQTLASWTRLPKIKQGNHTIRLVSIIGLHQTLSFGASFGPGGGGEAYLIGVKIDDQTELLGPWADSDEAANRFLEAMQPWSQNCFY